jgi:hypothetical protein
MIGDPLIILDRRLPPDGRRRPGYDRRDRATIDALLNLNLGDKQLNAAILVL